MGKKCLIEPNSEQEIEAIRDKHPFSITLYHSKNCPHCKELKPIIEKECEELKSLSPDELVAVIDCQVDNKDFCRNEAVAYGAKGIPFTVGKPRGQQPVFKIEGVKMDEINQYFGTLKEMIVESSNGKGGISSGGEQPRTSAPMLQNQQSGSSAGIHSNDSIHYDDKMVKAINGPRLNMGYQPRPQPRTVQLCSVGVNCNNDEYERRIVQFLNASKAKRKENKL